MSIRTPKFVNNCVPLYIGQLKEQLLQEIPVPLKILINKEIVGEKRPHLFQGFCFNSGDFLGNVCVIHFKYEK